MSDPYQPVDPSAPAPQPAGPVPGWYPDPSGTGGTRWWDGTAWSQDVRSPAVQARTVGFGEAIRRAFAGWSDYSSRSTVAEYWWYFLFEAILGIPLSIVMIVAFVSSFGTSTGADGSPVITSQGLSGPALVTLFLLGVVYVALFLVRLPLTVRRLHDTDRSGWWYFVSAIPFGGIVLIVFLIGSGTPGPNRWGPVPQ